MLTLGTEMDATHSEEFVEGAVSNGAVGTDAQISDAAEGADAGPDEGTSLAEVDAPPRFVPGQLVWAKFARFPWWPAQV